MLDKAELIAIRVCHDRPLDAVLIEFSEFVSSQLLHAANCRIEVGHIQIYVDTVFHFVWFWYFLEQQCGTLSLLPKSQVFLILVKNVSSQNLGPKLGTRL
jgi:hypothetical protein